jgi:DnaJ-class molecular chaperone
MREKCKVCDGSGNVESNKCMFCSGKGYYQIKKEEAEIYEDPPCGEIIEF